MLTGLILQCGILVNRLFVFPVGKQQQKGALSAFIPGKGKHFQSKKGMKQRGANAQCFYIVIAPKHTCLSVLYIHTCVKKKGHTAPRKRIQLMEVWNHLLL